MVDDVMLAESGADGGVEDPNSRFGWPIGGRGNVTGMASGGWFSIIGSGVPSDVNGKIAAKVVV